MIRKGFPERVLCTGHLRLKVIGPQYLKSRDPLLGPCKRFFNRRASRPILIIRQCDKQHAHAAQVQIDIQIYTYMYICIYMVCMVYLVISM